MTDKAYAASILVTRLKPIPGPQGLAPEYANVAVLATAPGPDVLHYRLMAFAKRAFPSADGWLDWAVNVCEDTTPSDSATLDLAGLVRHATVPVRVVKLRKPGGG